MCLGPSKQHDIYSHSKPLEWKPSNYATAYIKIQWGACSLLGYMNERVPQQNQSFYMTILGLRNENFSINIYAILSLPPDKPITDSVSLVFCQNLLQFRHFYHGLYTALQPLIGLTFEKMDTKFLFQNFGMKFLILMPNISLEKIQYFLLMIFSTVFFNN